MHDWNVDPHMAIPVINQLKDVGIESKGLFGQWDHDYPDRPDYHFDRSGDGRGREAYPEMVRFDWMQDLLEWFDWYLKGIGEQPGLFVEIQSNQGQWRIEDRYPPDGMEEIPIFCLTVILGLFMRVPRLLRTFGSPAFPDYISMYQHLPWEVKYTPFWKIALRWEIVFTSGTPLWT